MIIINEPLRINERCVIERTFITGEGYLGMCTFSNIGHRCGYVGITKDHAVWDLSYEDIYHVNVHGGLTFAGKHTPAKFPDHYFYGFDCGHYGDGRDLEKAVEYGFDVEYLRDFDDSLPKTLEFVIEEVQNLSRQLTPVALMKAKIENSNWR